MSKITHALISDVSAAISGSTQIDDSSVSTGSTWSSAKILGNITENTLFEKGSGLGSLIFKTNATTKGKIRFEKNSNIIIAVDGMDMLDSSESGLNWWWEFNIFNEDRTKLLYFNINDITSSTSAILGTYIEYSKTDDSLGWLKTNLTEDVRIDDYTWTGETGDYDYFFELIGDYSLTTGYNNQATGNGSHASGFNTKASGHYSHASGFETTASGEASHSEGSYTTASGAFSHAEGYNTYANGEFSHTEGYNNQADGAYSHAGGSSVFASGRASFNHSENNENGIAGATADNSAILGGVNHTVLSSATGSVILGGSGLTATVADTVYTPHLNVNGNLRINAPQVGSIHQGISLGTDYPQWMGSNGFYLTGTLYSQQGFIVGSGKSVRFGDSTTQIIGYGSLGTQGIDIVHSGSTVFKLVGNGNLILQSGGTFTDNGAKLQVSGKATTTGDIEITNINAGVIMKSPNGTRYRLQVNDDGTIKTTAI